MATGAITAGVIGAGMAAAGTAAAIRAARLKAQPRHVYFGGSADGYNALTDQYAGQVDQAGARVDGGVQGLAGAGNTGTQVAQSGVALLNSAGGVNPVPVGNRAMSLLDAYKPGDVAAAESQRVLDANAQQNLGAARSGGALSLRSALNANAFAGVRAAQDVAAQRAQEEQSLLGAKVGQTNADRQAEMDSTQLAESQNIARAQAGAQIATAGNAQTIGAAGQTAQLGLGQQNLYQDALQSTQNNQFQADMDYEQRRQAERQRRSDRLWQFGGSLINGGAGIAASGGYGGKGGGGGK